MKSDADVARILEMDGINNFNMDDANQEVINISDIFQKYNLDDSWSHTLINTKSNSATIICQMPGEGNREHYHPEWDEWWFILKGEWHWIIEGKKKTIKEGDFICIKRNRIHQIIAAGDGPAIRLAVSRYDVAHVYSENAYQK
jgi:quercetin dioxygenase-like cupin family protein